MSDLVTIVVPARDEADTIARVIENFRDLPWVGEVLVVDNGSKDGTGAAARSAGARVVDEPRAGMGSAIKAGFAASRFDWVMKVDADLDRFDTTLFSRMPAARADGIGLVKGNWQDPADNMPMTRLLVAPAVAYLAPGLKTLNAPNSGIYLVNRKVFAHQELVDTYAADLDVMLRVYAAGAGVAEVDIGRISHDTRDLGHYNAMAETILQFFMEQQQKCLADELVFAAPGAEDVIVASMGLIAARARAGALVHIYLDRIEDPAFEILNDCLAPFPTVRVMPLPMAQAFNPRGPERRIKLFAPYPQADKARALCAALAIRADLETRSVSSPDLLLMTPMQRQGLVLRFQPDRAFDVREGQAIQARALTRLRDAGLGYGPEPSTREMYQSYASLPDALKGDLISDIDRTEVSNPA